MSKVEPSATLDHNPRRIAIQFLVALISAGIFLGVIWKQGQLTAPPIDADGAHYEAIATNLSRNLGFGVKFDEEYLSPHRSQNRGGGSEAILSGEFEQMLAVMGMDGTTTFRPPLYPWLLSLAYRATPRSFVIYKILNASLLGIGAALVCSLVYRIGGFPPAFFCWVLLIGDLMLHAVCRLCLTESLAFPLVALLMVLLGRWWDRPSWTLPPSIGCVLALLLLTRSIYLIWIPCVTFACWGVHWRRSTLKKANFVACVILIVTLLMFAPWGIRNMIVLESPMPFGSQGGIALGMIYDDNVLLRNGSFDDQRFRAYAESYRGQETGLARERALAQLGTANARSWLRAHPEIVPKLMVLRVVSLWWWDTEAPQRLLILLALFGAVSLRGNIALRAILLLAAAHTLAISLTSSLASGRYLLSVYPVVIVLASFCLSKVVDIIWWLRLRWGRANGPSQQNDSP